MSDRILLRRGNKADLPVLNTGEPGFATDTKELFVGTGSVNEVIHSNSGFRASQSAAQSISASTFTKILFQTEFYDNNSEYDTSLSRFTAKNNGIFYVSASVNIQGHSDGSSQILAIYKNGSAYARVYQANAKGTTDLNVSGSLAVELTSGDYIEMYVFSSSACNTSIGTELTNFVMKQF